MSDLDYTVSVEAGTAASGLERLTEQLREANRAAGDMGKTDPTAGISKIESASKNSVSQAIRSFSSLRSSMSQLMSGDVVGAGMNLSRGFSGISGAFRLAMMGPIGLVGAALAGAIAGVKIREMLQEKFNINIGIPNLDVPEAPFKKWRADADDMAERLAAIDKVKYDKQQKEIEKVAAAFERAAEAARKFMAAQTELTEAESALNIAQIKADKTLTPEQRDKQVARAEEMGVNSKAVMDVAAVDQDERLAQQNRKNLKNEIDIKDKQEAEAKRQYQVANPENKRAYRELWEKAKERADAAREKNLPQIEAIDDDQKNYASRRDTISKRAEAQKIGIQTAAKDKADADAEKALKEKTRDKEAENKALEAQAQYKIDQSTPEEQLKIAEGNLKNLAGKRTALETKRASKGGISADEQLDLTEIIGQQTDQFGKRDKAKKDIEEKTKPEKLLKENETDIKYLDMQRTALETKRASKGGISADEQRDLAGITKTLSEKIKTGVKISSEMEKSGTVEGKNEAVKRADTIREAREKISGSREMRVGGSSIGDVFTRMNDLRKGRTPTDDAARQTAENTKTIAENTKVLFNLGVPT